MANQFRFIGSAVGLSIVTSVFNGYVQAQFASIGLPDNLQSLESSSLLALPYDLQNQIRIIIAEGYNRQNLVLVAFSAAQVFAPLLMWKKQQIVPV